MIIHKLSTSDDVKNFCTDWMVNYNKQRLYKGEMMGILVEASAL